MPVKFLYRYTRQQDSCAKKGALVVPETALLKPNLDTRIAKIVKSMPPPTVSPHSFHFHYIDHPFDNSIFRDGATLDNGVYSFEVKKAVLGIYDLQAFKEDEFCWSFATTHQTMVLAALKIGDTFDVKLKKPFSRILHISRSHFPPGVPNSGYGEYAVHISNDEPQNDWFRITTSYEPDSKTTDSRLPFFFGFRLFGLKGEDKRPMWRRFLSDAAIYARKEFWGMALMNVAFSLESFIDQALTERLKPSKLPATYVDHILQVGAKREEFHVLWTDKKSSKNAINKYYENVNSNIFGLRNSIAHGKITSESITADQFVKAIKTAVEFIWDYDTAARKYLIPVVHMMDASTLIDKQLIKNCWNTASVLN